MTFYYKYAKEVEGKQVKAKEKKIDYQHSEKRNVERMMYPHLGNLCIPELWCMQR